jgi:hypothetical protein
MRTHAGPKQALLRADALIQKGLDSQAQLWAYVDDFRYQAPLCVLSIPIAFFKPDPGAKGAG